MNSEKFKELTKNYSDKTLIFVSNMTKEYTLKNPLESRDNCSLSEVSNLFCCYNQKHTVELKELRALNNETINIDIEDGFVFRPLHEILFFDDYLILLTK